MELGRGIVKDPLGGWSEAIPQNAKVFNKKHLTYLLISNSLISYLLISSSLISHLPRNRNGRISTPRARQELSVAQSKDMG